MSPAPMSQFGLLHQQQTQPSTAVPKTSQGMRTVRRSMQMPMEAKSNRAGEDATANRLLKLKDLQVDLGHHTKGSLISP